MRAASRLQAATPKRRAEPDSQGGDTWLKHD